MPQTKLAKIISPQEAKKYALAASFLKPHNLTFRWSMKEENFEVIKRTEHGFQFICYADFSTIDPELGFHIEDFPALEKALFA